MEYPVEYELPNQGVQRVIFVLVVDRTIHIHLSIYSVLWNSVPEMSGANE